MSDLISRLNPVRASVVGLTLLLLLVVLIRSPTDEPLIVDATEAVGGGQPAEAEAGIAGDSAQQAGAGTGCFGTGSTRAEVSRVMGAPDSIVFGEWLYGRSGVTFGYGTVLDYSNRGSNLRLC